MRCHVCDYCDSAPSIYHTSLAGMKSRRVTMDEYGPICDDCRGLAAVLDTTPTYWEVEHVDEREPDSEDELLPVKDS
jgi:hypothetical protein